MNNKSESDSVYAYVYKSEYYKHSSEIYYYYYYNRFTYAEPVLQLSVASYRTINEK